MGGQGPRRFQNKVVTLGQRGSERSFDAERKVFGFLNCKTIAIRREDGKALQRMKSVFPAGAHMQEKIDLGARHMRIV
jgi:hypothetical protein